MAESPIPVPLEQGDASFDDLTLSSLSGGSPPPLRDGQGGGLGPVPIGPPPGAQLPEMYIIHSDGGAGEEPDSERAPSEPRSRAHSVARPPPLQAGSRGVDDPSGDGPNGGGNTPAVSGRGASGGGNTPASRGRSNSRTRSNSQTPRSSRSCADTPGASVRRGIAKVRSTPRTTATREPCSSSSGNRDTLAADDQRGDVTGEGNTLA